MTSGVDFSKPIRLKNNPNLSIKFIGKHPNCERVVVVLNQYNAINTYFDDCFENIPEKHVVYVTTYRTKNGFIESAVRSTEQAIDDFYSLWPSCTHLVTTVVEIDIP